MSFLRKPNDEPRIDLTPMVDVVFLLLIFFMTTTIFKMEDGLQVSLPRAETAAKQKRELISHIWIDATGVISINDKLVQIADIETIIKSFLIEKPSLIVAFNADHRTPYGIISEVMEQLKMANAIRVSFTSDMERAGASR